ncbi:MAG: type I restriction endonuclease [Dehalococcoidia bacterium]
MSEADTRSRLIDPVLAIFGFGDWTTLQREVRIGATGQYADYVLSRNGQPCFVVEAKGNQVSLSEAHVAQAMQYGVVLGVPLCLVTNGIEWRLHDIRLAGGVNSSYVASFDLRNPRSFASAATLLDPGAPARNRKSWVSTNPGTLKKWLVIITLVLLPPIGLFLLPLLGWHRSSAAIGITLLLLPPLGMYWAHLRWRWGSSPEETVLGSLITPLGAWWMWRRRTVPDWVPVLGAIGSALFLWAEVGQPLINLLIS